MSRLSDNIADAVIGVLSGFNGFDYWWGCVDDDCSDDIMRALSQEIESWIESRLGS